MTPDDKPEDSSADGFSVFMPPRPRRSGLAARHILFVGVAGACVLGVGLGLWARPAMSERQASAKPLAVADAPPKAPVAAHKLEIVVDSRPAPIGAPIDVLPASAVASPATKPQAAPSHEPAPLAPARPPLGLMRVVEQFILPPPPPLPPVKPSEARPAAKPRLARVVVAARAARPAVVKAAPAPMHLAKAAPPPKPAAKVAPKIDHRVELARAAAAKAAAHRIELAQAAQEAKAAKAEHQHELQLAKAQAKAAHLQQVQLARVQAKAAHQQQMQLAKAEAKGRAEARAEAKAELLAEARDDARKRARLAALAHAFQRMLPHQARPAPVEVAQVDRRHAHKSRREVRIEQASLRSHRPPRAAEPTYRARTAPAPPQARPSGLMRVSAPRCANRDPGQALVCADPSLGAADRQLTRAYQDARAAGVPDAQLQRQQARWLSARSAAAREAPWAVHDVYLARIAELNGLAKEAHGDGY